MNNTDNMYKNLATLYLNNKTIDDVLNLFGLEKFYLYGFCRMSELVIDSTNMKVVGVIDKDVTRHGTRYCSEANERNNSTEIYSINDASRDDIPIVIALGAHTIDIRNELINCGIDEKRISFLNLMLCVGAQLSIKSDKDMWQNCDIKSKNLYLITGTRFGNRGSQAMMLSSSSEIVCGDPNALVFCALNYYEQEYEKEYRKTRLIYLTDGYEEGSTLDELAPNLSLIVDAAGYAIASTGAVNNTKRTIRYMEIAKKYNIPMYLLPQSYGPLDFVDEVDQKLRELLPMMKAIYAREIEGFDLMKSKYHLNNIILSEDIVITRSVDSKVYCEQNVCGRSLELSGDRVAVIPNIQLYRYGEKDKVIMCYREVIGWLLSNGKNVDIIFTSEDKEIGWNIYKEYIDNKAVKLIRDVLDIKDFCEVLKNYQYVIASRYHSVILSYKESVPCIVLGWAVKYKRLSMLFGQSDYEFDISQEFDVNNIICALSRLDKNYRNESIIIKEKTNDLVDSKKYLSVN